MESENLLRVIISESNIRKLKVSNLKTVKELEEIIRGNFQIENDFIVQYYDNDFKEYFNLENVSDLIHMGTVKIIEQTDVEKHNDTDSLNSRTLPVGETSGNSKPWPGSFPLPNFHDNPYIKSHLDFMAKSTDEKYIPEMLKRKVVAAMVDEVIKYTYYPNGKDIENLCRFYLFIWDFTSLSTLYRSYHDG